MPRRSFPRRRAAAWRRPSLVAACVIENRRGRYGNPHGPGTRAAACARVRASYTVLNASKTSLVIALLARTVHPSPSPKESAHVHAIPTAARIARSPHPARSAHDAPRISEDRGPRRRRGTGRGLRVQDATFSAEPTRDGSRAERPELGDGPRPQLSHARPHRDAGLRHLFRLRRTGRRRRGPPRDRPRHQLFRHLARLFARLFGKNAGRRHPRHPTRKTVRRLQILYARRPPEQRHAGQGRHGRDRGQPQTHRHGLPRLGAHPRLQFH